MLARHRSSLAYPLLAFLTACGGGGSTLDDASTCSSAANCSLEIVSGDGQSGPVTFELAEPFVVRVVHTSGQAVPPVEIAWRAVEGGGSIANMSTTDATGQAQATGRLGELAGAGSNVFEASVVGVEGISIQFSADAEAGDGAIMEIVQGDGQSVAAAQELPERLTIKVTDEFGNPIEGWRVSWFASQGGGEVRDLINMTDANGEASAIGVVGTEAGPDSNLFTARAQGDLMGNPAQFIASVEPAPPELMMMVSGDSQGGTRGQPVPEPFVVRIIDRYTNPIPGVTVTWSTGNGDGTVTPDEVQTDENGEAQGFGILGPAPGAHEFIASVDGLNGSPMTFVANAFPPLCSRDDWCWMSPLPQGNDVRAAYPISETELWLVGDHGTALRWNGSAWEGFETNTTANLTGVWGAASDDVWATTDDGDIIHFDGFRWTNSTTGQASSFNGIWGSSANDVWAVGTQGTLLHWDGMAWSPNNLGPDVTLYGIWGRSASEVWITGSRGGLWSKDATGLSWSPISTGAMEDLYDVWADGNGKLWVVGNRATIRVFDGANWDEVVPPTNNALYGVWGDSEDEVYTVGARGSVVRWDGLRWINDPSGTNNNLFDVVRVADDFLVTVGEAGIVMQRGAVEWTAQAENIPTELQGVWGAAADDVWAVGFRSTILHWDGLTWSRAEAPRGSHFAIHGTGPDNVWAVGAAGSLFEWDGSTWSDRPRPLTEDLYTVWTPTATSAWAAGVAGTILEYDGNTSRWEISETPTENSIYGVWGARETEIWAVGDFGTVLKYDGTQWTNTATVPTGQSLLAIRGSAADDIWAAGASGVVLHYDGVTWSSVNVGTTSTLYNIHVIGPNDVWIAGENGTILHWDGVSWLREASGTGVRLFGISGAVPEELWVVGDKRAILRKTRMP